MNLSIADRQDLLRQDTNQQIQTQIASALAKFGKRIGRVDIQVADLTDAAVDHPRMNCRVIAEIRKLGPVAVAVTEESLSKAISLAISRVEKAVSRRIRRQAINADHRRAEDTLVPKP